MIDSMFKVFVPLLGSLLFTLSSNAQSALDAYIFEENNRGFIKEASVQIFQLPENYVRGEYTSDQDGHFKVPLAPGQYRVVSKKELFYPKMDTFTVGSTTTFVKISMQRRPGYLFDATIAEERTSSTAVVDGVSGSRVEIYNRTTRKNHRG